MKKRAFKKRKRGLGRAIPFVDHTLASRILDWSVGLLLAPNTTPCWIWRGYRDKDGYGEIKYRGYKYRAARVSYAAFVDAIPDGMDVDHTCNVECCVNPRHLKLVDPLTNIKLRDERKSQPMPNVEPLPF